MKWWDRIAMILVFWMLSFKQCFHSPLNLVTEKQQILLFRCSTANSSLQLLKDASVAPKFWQLWIQLLSTSVCGFVWGLNFQFIGVNSQGHDCRTMWEFAQFCEKPPNCPPKWQHHSASPPEMNQGFLWPHTLARTWRLPVPGASTVLSGVQERLGVVIWNSLMTHDVEHRFIRLLIMHLLWWGVYSNLLPIS